MPATIATQPEALEDQWWRAVQERDSRMAGRFIVAVRSTGVFCRPGCPARMPRRENVTFFETADEASAAGFRACLRCHPTEPHRLDVEIVRAARTTFAASDGYPGVPAMAAAARVSEHALRVAFQRVLGATPRVAWEQDSLENARGLLRDGAGVADAIYGSGFGSSRGFYEAAGKGLGMAPATYRRGGAGERIGFAIVPASLGDVLVAMTEKGLCTVRLGEREELEEEFRAEFSRAELKADDEQVVRAAARVARVVDGEVAALELPLDLRGTAFQMRVWAALQAIPPGQTRSYRELAESIGEPKAARAVAQACASNRVAVIVPCHRVVEASGGLGGYRWGRERKQALLAREQRSSHGE